MVCVVCLSGLRGVCGVSECCGGVIECYFCFSKLQYCIIDYKHITTVITCITFTISVLFTNP